MRALPILVLIFTIFVAPGTVLAEPPDIAFDQAQRIYVIDTSAAPPLGAFDDFRNTFEKVARSVTFPPLPGVLPTAPGAGGLLAGRGQAKRRDRVPL